MNWIVWGFMQQDSDESHLGRIIDTFANSDREGPIDGLRLMASLDGDVCKPTKKNILAFFAKYQSISFYFDLPHRSGYKDLSERIRVELRSSQLLSTWSVAISSDLNERLPPDPESIAKLFSSLAILQGFARRFEDGQYSPYLSDASFWDLEPQREPGSNLSDLLVTNVSIDLFYRFLIGSEGIGYWIGDQFGSARTILQLVADSATLARVGSGVWVQPLDNKLSEVHKLLQPFSTWGNNIRQLITTYEQPAFIPAPRFRRK